MNNLLNWFNNPKKLVTLSLLTFLIFSSVLFINLKHGNTPNLPDPQVNQMPVASMGIRNLKTEKDMTTPKVKGVFVVLVRNQELQGWLSSMDQLEKRFNNRYDYPYVFLNDKNFTSEFKESVTSRTSAKVQFGLIPKNHWGYPEFIDQHTAADTRFNSKDMDYGTSESYRHMCRFESGFFFRHPLLKEYDYYWRVEPDIEFLCDIEPDPFRFIHENGIKYSYTIALKEAQITIPTLWETVWKFIDSKNLREKLPKDNALDWVSNDRGKTYNRCHFWSNFEIASLDLWRDPQYIEFFEYLDKSGGFFYERWGDAPVHTIYAALFLPRNEIHFFNEIGYVHDGVIHCPREEGVREKCHCDAGYHTVTHNEDHSCVPSWIRLINHKNLFSFDKFGL